MTCLPAPGNFNPLVPLLRACSGAGDDVLVATGPAVRDRVERAGATWQRAGAGFDEWFPRLAGRTRGEPGGGIPPEQVPRYWVPRLFGEVAADDMIDGVLEAIETHRPDLLVFETNTFAGPLAARIRDVAQAHLQVGTLYDPLVLALSADAIAPLWHSFGLGYPEDAAVYAGPTLRTIPPSLDPRPLPGGDALPIRPVDLPRPAARADRPTVHLTLGTALNRDLDILRAFVDSAVDAPYDVVVTVGENNDPRQFDPLPPNVTVERYVDHGELLPQCTAIVHQGGIGTSLTASAHGLPQVVVPQGADQFDNAAMLAAAGISLTIEPGAVTASSIRSAVDRLLDDGSFAVAAQTSAVEILAMPSPEEARAELERRFAPG